MHGPRWSCFTKVTSTGNVMPMGVMKGNYTLGTSYTIYGDRSSSNNGALSLDIAAGADPGRDQQLGGLTWPAGSSSVTVVGFANFVITGVAARPSRARFHPDGKYVNGTFCGMIDSNTAYTTGTWTPASNSAGTVELTS